MNKPKIAVLMDWYLPGTKAGGPVRSVYSLISLLKNDFDFYLITTNQDLGCVSCYENITPDTFIQKENVHYYYFSKENLCPKKMLELLSGIKPDLVYLNSFWSYHFSISIINLKRKGLLETPVLLAPRGMLGKGALGLKSLKKQVFLFIVRALGWYRHITFHATQQQEVADIRSKFPRARIHTAMNLNASPAHENKSVKAANKLKLFFLSRISPVKNLHFALDVLRSIPKNYKIEYDIFGNLESQEYWHECKKIIDALPENISVNYKRELAFNEVQDMICHYHFLFLPTLNENFGHSIVESLLCGCPAIISDQTPWNDLEANNAGYAIALDNKPKFADILIQAAQLDQDQFSQKSQAAIAYITKKTNLPLVLNQYKTLFNDILKN